MNRSDICLDIRINERGISPHDFDRFIHSQREGREMRREARNQNNLMVMKHNSEEEFQNYRIDNFLSSKNLSSRRKEERKSNSDTHSPFMSMNEQVLPENPIDDYGRTWTSATLATP